MHIKSNRVRIISRGCHDWHMSGCCAKWSACALSEIVTLVREEPSGLHPIRGTQLPPARMSKA